jgi:preprotein translocase subunit SecD
MKELLKEWRIWLVIVSVLFSIYLISPFPQKGVVVTYISEDSPFKGKIEVGETITWANEKEISSPEDFYSFENFTGTFRFMHSGKLDLVNIEKPGLGLIVKKKPFSNLQFGLDLVGGTRVLLKPKENVTDATIQQAIATLETRINIFGLREATFQPVKDVAGNNYIQIEMAGGSKEEVENLLAKQGKFEGKILRVINFKNKIGSIKLMDNHLIRLVNGKIEVNATVLKENETSQLEGVDFQVLNLTEENVTLAFTVFTGKDIQSVCLQDQPGICVSRIIKQGGGWVFNFQVFVTQEGAEKFAKVTNGMDIVTDPTTGEKYLDGKISLYLDEKLITELNIASELKGQVYTTPAITGFRRIRTEAIKEQLMLKSILQSGALPTSVEIVRIDEISPALGREFFESAILSTMIAFVAVACVLYFRYRNFKILIPNMLWSLMELILTLGGAALIKWTIDLSSIAGIIAGIGSGTNDQIMIIDEILAGGSKEGEKFYTLKQRIKRAFFIIFGSAATVAASVVPMMFIGVGAMKGFAVTTILGIIIGVFITRPAFSIVAERILKKG